MFIVHVHHDGSGHGEESDVVLLTGDIIRAVGTARSAHQFGFSFNEETYIEVSCPIPEKIYEKEDSPVVFRIHRFQDEQTEEWLDADLEKKFKKNLSLILGSI
ncbi:MAG: hypothetical protein Q8R36_05855 [bacterium]|nr:hypothetical protein [bacterium]